MASSQWKASIIKNRLHLGEEVKKNENRVSGKHCELLFSSYKLRMYIRVHFHDGIKEKKNMIVSNGTTVMPESKDNFDF